MVTKAVQAKVAECPDCGQEITLQGAVKIGRRVTCPHCKTDLEVVEAAPVELSWYYEESEDDEDW
jgi:lysine biosynthesis protein LysW